MSNVRIENLGIRLSGVDIISGLSLDVQAGEFLVLLGPSGCCKSTLLHAIAGLIDVEVEIGEDGVGADAHAQLLDGDVQNVSL